MRKNSLFILMFLLFCACSKDSDFERVKDENESLLNYSGSFKSVNDAYQYAITKNNDLENDMLQILKEKGVIVSKSDYFDLKNGDDFAIFSANSANIYSRLEDGVNNELVSLGNTDLSPQVSNYFNELQHCLLGRFVNNSELFDNKQIFIEEFESEIDSFIGRVKNDNELSVKEKEHIVVAAIAMQETIDAIIEAIDGEVYSEQSSRIQCGGFCRIVGKVVVVAVWTGGGALVGLGAGGGNPGGAVVGGAVGLGIGLCVVNVYRSGLICGNR